MRELPSSDRNRFSDDLIRNTMFLFEMSINKKKYSEPRGVVGPSFGRVTDSKGEFDALH